MERTIEISIRVRGEGNEVDYMSHTVSFEEFGKTGLRTMTKLFEELLGKIVTTRILKRFIETSTVE